MNMNRNKWFIVTAVLWFVGILLIMWFIPGCQKVVIVEQGADSSVRVPDPNVDAILLKAGGVKTVDSPSGESSTKVDVDKGVKQHKRLEVLKK